MRLGWLLEQIAQEERCGLDLLGRHCLTGVGERVSAHKIEKGSGHYLCRRGRHQALESNALAAMLQLFCRDHCKVFTRLFQSISQEVVRGDFVFEYRIRQKRRYQIVGYTDQVL